MQNELKSLFQTQGVYGKFSKDLQSYKMRYYSFSKTIMILHTYE